MTIAPPLSAGLMMMVGSVLRSFNALISPCVKFLEDDDCVGSEVMWLIKLLEKLSIKWSLPGGGVHPEDCLKGVKGLGG